LKPRSVHDVGGVLAVWWDLLLIFQSWL
jgi:hypothetical protein